MILGHVHRSTETVEVNHGRQSSAVNMKILLYWLVHVLLLERFNTEVLGCIACCGCGALDRVDPYVFVGEMLNMTCTLTENTVAKGVNASDLYFHSVNGNIVQVNETTVINSTSLTMNKMMTTLYNGPYYCDLRRLVTGIPNKYVDMTWVEVEHHPRPAENFNCIIYDWDVSMECTWDLGVEYGNENNIKTTLIMAFGKCPNQELRKCTWVRENGVSFDQTTLQFKINVTNNKRDVTASTEWITIKQDDYVKPSKVDYLIVNTLNSTCATLEWRHHREFRTKAFIITVNSRWNENKTIETKTNSATVCDLKPNTLYNFTIETVPAIGKGYRSAKVYNSTVTHVSAPGRPPEVVDGAYTTDNKKCNRNTRDVVVYWKSLPLEYQNGRMIGYHVSVSNDTGLLYDQTVTDPNHWYQHLTLPCDQQIKVAIMSLGEAANSSASSVIVISQDKEIVMPKQVIVEAQKNSTDTTVNVSWTRVEYDGVTSYTVFYCQYDTECTNEISWNPVGPNYTFVTLDHIQFDKNYRFGVSADFNGSSSGFEWETCHYFKSIMPRPPSTVEVVAYPENSITIDWSDPVCGSSPFIQDFKITWCIADEVIKQCKGPQNEKTIPSTKDTLYVIKDLYAKTTYGIRVQFVAGDGRISDFSEMQLVQVYNNNLLEGELVGISMAAVFLVLLSIAGVLFVWKTCNSGITKMRTPYRIDMIKVKTSNVKDQLTSISSSTSSSMTNNSSDRLIPGDYKQIKLVSQLSKDSGRGSLASDLQSPRIERRSGELYPLEENMTNRKSTNSRHKYSSDHMTELAQSHDSDYSKIALDSEQIDVQCKMKENAVTAELHTSSNSMPQKCCQISDDSSSPSSSINTFSYTDKSSSEEKILVHLDDVDSEDGYTEHGGKCRSIDVVTRTKNNDDCNDSYIRQEDNTHSSATKSTINHSYISRNSSHNVNMMTHNIVNAVQLEVLEMCDNEEDLAANLNYYSPSVAVKSLNQEQNSYKTSDFLNKDSRENPKLFDSYSLIPISDSKCGDPGRVVDETSYLSKTTTSHHNNYFASKKIVRPQENSGSDYISEMDATAVAGSKKCEERTSEVMGSGGYVSENSLFNISSPSMNDHNNIDTYEYENSWSMVNAVPKSQTDDDTILGDDIPSQQLLITEKEEISLDDSCDSNVLFLNSQTDDYIPFDQLERGIDNPSKNI